jgi:hypothetical protein
MNVIKMQKKNDEDLFIIKKVGLRVRWVDGRAELILADL